MIEIAPIATVEDRERAFFDHEAACLDDRQLVADPKEMQRYREARGRFGNSAKDTLFARLAPLAGRRLLDYGCGTGEDTCHLADCGAVVTAFDLSPASVEVARHRAKLNGLADRIQFDVRPAGQIEYPAESFEIVVGFAILHHLHHMLPEVYREIRKVLTPGGSAYFIEPVANSHLLRGLRKCVPVPTNATPDERQLRLADFELMREFGFGNVRYDYFHCLSRFRRFTGRRGQAALRWVDAALLRAAPVLKCVYGTVLVEARA